MPKYRAGAFDKGSRQKGQYVVVDSASRAQAMLEVRKFFPGVPIARIFAIDAEMYDKIDNVKHPFAFNNRQPKGAQ